MQQIQTSIHFVGVDDQFVVNAEDQRRRVLRTARISTSTARKSNFSKGVTRSMPLIINAAMEARNSSAGLNASLRPATSVSRISVASFVRARLPWPSMRSAVT